MLPFAAGLVLFGMMMSWAVSHGLDPVAGAVASTVPAAAYGLFFMVPFGLRAAAEPLNPAFFFRRALHFAWVLKMAGGAALVLLMTIVASAVLYGLGWGVVHLLEATGIHHFERTDYLGRGIVAGFIGMQALIGVEVLKAMRRNRSWKSALKAMRPREASDLAVMWQAAEIRQVCAWLSADGTLLAGTQEVRSFSSLLVAVLQGRSPQGTPDFLKALKPGSPSVRRLLQLLEDRLEAGGRRGQLGEGRRRIGVGDRGAA